MSSSHPLTLLGLSNKELRVFGTLTDSGKSVAQIAFLAKVSRPSVYDILKKLRSRGLVMSTILHAKKTWKKVPEREMSDRLYELKKSLLDFSDGTEEIKGISDGLVTVHRGDEAVKRELIRVFTHGHKRMAGYVGTLNYAENWAELFKDKEIREVNVAIKKSGMIIDAVLPDNYTKDQYDKLGHEWAKSYEGRTASTVYADKKYFQNSGEVYFFRDTLYLLALRDRMIIEIRHGDLQKMILDIFTFMKDHSKKVDINRELRELIEKAKPSAPGPADSRPNSQGEL